MNKARRNRLNDAISYISTAKEIIEEVKEAEEEAFDNLPEGIQCSERGETMEGYIGDLENAMDDLENIMETLEEVIS